VAVQPETGPTRPETSPGWRVVLLPWLLRGLLAIVLLGGLAIGLITLVLHLAPLEECTVLDTDTSPGVVTNIGSQPPGWSLSGPAAVSTDVGTANQSYQQLRAFQFFGPIRPWITTNAGARELARAATSEDAGARAQTDFQGCARDWAVSRTRMVVVGQAVIWLALLAAGAVLAVWGVQLLRTRRFWTVFGAVTVLSMVTTSTVWGGSLLLATRQAQDMIVSVHSLADLVSYSKVRASPPPVGPPQLGYGFVSLGDSEYSLLGGKQPETYPDEAAEACNRSTDSLAAVLSNLTGARALNLACPSATIATGIEGPQTRHGHTVPPQLSLLQQVRDPQVVTVGVGANDAAWSVFLGVCLATACDAAEVSTLLESKFRAQLDAFVVQNNDMLDDLATYRSSQSSHPQIVVIGPYQPFGEATCSEISPGPGLVFTSAEVAILDRARSELVDVLRSGAEAHGFTYLEPRLVPLCAEPIPSLGPDIQPGSSPDRYHPTAVGELKIGMQVLEVLQADRAEEASSPPVTPSGDGTVPSVPASGTTSVRRGTPSPR
jgi:hypothetical protein